LLQAIKITFKTTEISITANYDIFGFWSIKFCSFIYALWRLLKSQTASNLPEMKLSTWKRKSHTRMETEKTHSAVIFF